MNYLVVSNKDWNKELYESLGKQFKNHDWYWIGSKDDFSEDRISEINPNKIFIPHWSYIINEQIYSKFECIVFHMTDLPFGRGGSPLQNLIVRGFDTTMISALRVEKGIDTGPIYLKRPIDLHGTALQIFKRSNEVIYEMIKEIIIQNPEPVKQEGEILIFKRRTPDQSDISHLESLHQIFDYIRMLDAPGYPHAYLENGNLKLTFTNAEMKDDNTLTANVEITRK